MIIYGGEITCFGKTVNYDYKEVTEGSGALIVSLKIEDSSAEDAFQRVNITNLVIDSEGRLHAYNVKFASTFVRPEVETAE